MLKLLGAEAAGLTRAKEGKILAAVEQDLEVLREFNRRVDRLERSVSASVMKAKFRTSSQNWRRHFREVRRSR